MNDLKKHLFNSVLITKINLKNGQSTELITMLNSNAMSFEEVYKGIQTTVKLQYGIIQSYQATIYTLSEKKLNKFIEYPKEFI